MRVGNIATFDSVYSLLQEGYGGARTIGIFPGGFKPPHKGHFLTAESACKTCDVVYILMSDKSRKICSMQSLDKSSSKSRAGSSPSIPEWRKFESLLPGGKAHEALSNSRVELAEVDRTTSASEMRAEILNNALDTCDMITFNKNLGEYVPDIPGKDKVLEIIRASTNVREGVITWEESDAIWGEYLGYLQEKYKNVKINYQIIPGSPVGATYALVEDLDRSGDSPNNILLYTGT